MDFPGSEDEPELHLLCPGAAHVSRRATRATLPIWAVPCSRLQLAATSQI